MTDSCDVVRYVSVSCELFSFLVSNLSQVRKLRHLSFTDCGIQPFRNIFKVTMLSTYYLMRLQLKRPNQHGPQRASAARSAPSSTTVR